MESYTAAGAQNTMQAGIQQPERQIKFPIASVFGALMVSLNIIHLIYVYLLRGMPVIPFFLILSILYNLCMAVLTGGLFMRKRNAVITGPLLLLSLGSMFNLVQLALGLIMKQSVLFPEYLRGNLGWTVGLGGCYLTIFLSWFLLFLYAGSWFRDPESGFSKSSASLWALPGIFGLIHSFGALIAHSVLGGITNALMAFLIEVPFLFLLGWWLTHPFRVPPRSALQYASAAVQYSEAPRNIRPAFCPFCGMKLAPEHVFCPGCGRPVNSLNTGAGTMSEAGGAAYMPAGAEADIPTGGLKVLCFLAPGVGLILYLVWKDTLPAKAGACGRSAVWGGIFWIVITILLTVLSFLIPMIILGVSFKF